MKSTFERLLNVNWLRLETALWWAIDINFDVYQSVTNLDNLLRYILENPTVFKQVKMPAPPEKSAPELTSTVDTAEQSAFADTIYYDYLIQCLFYIVRVSWGIDYLKSKGHQSCNE